MEENRNLPVQQQNHLTKVNKTLEITNKILALQKDPFLIPYRKGDKWGFCDRDKKIVIPCKYGMVRQFSAGLAGVKDYSGKWGFVDIVGEEIIPCIYKSIFKFIFIKISYIITCFQIF